MALESIQPWVTPAMNATLRWDITQKELESVVRAMAKGKAPRG